MSVPLPAKFVARIIPPELIFSINFSYPLLFLEYNFNESNGISYKR